MTIPHRMQVVISLFLKYHGRGLSPYLQVYPTAAPWDSEDIGLKGAAFW